MFVCMKKVSFFLVFPVYKQRNMNQNQINGKIVQKIHSLECVQLCLEAF